MNKYKQYFNTVKYMKFTQIQYRVYYMLRSKYRKATKFSYPLIKPSSSLELNFIDSINSYKSYDNDIFTFLNISQEFPDAVDWNFSEHGKLWVYNLNYFEYLNQKDFEKDVGLDFINDFIDNIQTLKDALEPFPNSLRGINWIKFLSMHKIKNQKIDDSLYAQYYILLDTLEYHILGNHLLENGFSLLFGAYYFNDSILFQKAKQILLDELTEQTLADGAHYELTPMYHQLMLFRILDCLNLVNNNMNFKDDQLNEMLETKAVDMLSWLDQISYKDGSIPHFNDSSDHIAPTTAMLFAYAKRLGLETQKMIPLKESGYRAVNNDFYELRVDVGEIGPSYIPGHAHSDTFNFELQIAGKPFIVDTGISTYESNAKRLQERQTSAHNTVQIGNIEQSGVWSSFRVANRAHIISLKEDENVITASHDGYKKLGIIHQRTFTTTEKSIQIKDLLMSKDNSKHKHVTYIHFHPTIDDIKIENEKVITQNVIFLIKGSKNLQLDDFTFANGFNKHKDAKVLKITFESDLLVEIEII